MSLKTPFIVLLAPLDWGLGHATRCIPIIKELIKQQAQVILAVNKVQKALLLQEFPDLECLDIPAYPISLKRGFLLKWALLFRVPFILRHIKLENNWLNDLKKARVIHAVISDNRYGLYHKDMPCIFITHQLSLQSGVAHSANWTRPSSAWRQLPAKKIDGILLKIHYHFIRKFNACWIPDTERDPSVAGKLSHPPIPIPIAHNYIGLLSRFHSLRKPVQPNSLLVLISGPEPQRSDFEKILFAQLKVVKMNICVIRGLPDAYDMPIANEGDIRIINHLPAQQLEQLIAESEYIISRSGYSTIMDLLIMQKTALLIPTPGQTEQEYLGARLHELKWMYSVEEKALNLARDIELVRHFEFHKPEVFESYLEEAVSDLLNTATEKL